LANLRGLNALQRLKLNGDNIGDTGLANLKGMTALKELEIFGNQTSKEGRNEFRKACPAVEIIVDRDY
jgi:hypothetical protein